MVKRIKALKDICNFLNNIGHHKVWHGHTDIMIKDTQNPIGIVKVVPDPNPLHGDEYVPTSTKRLKTEDDEVSDLNSSLSGDRVSDVKRRHFDQAVAQAVVFALAQKGRTTSFIPNILMSRNKFYVIMYDPHKDILIWSGEFPLWTKNSPSSLNRHSVISLWLVLHFNLFCYGGDIIKNQDEVKAGFFSRIGEEQRKFYEHLDVGVEHFESEEPAIGPSHSLSDIIHPVEVRIENKR